MEHTTQLHSTGEQPSDTIVSLLSDRRRRTAVTVLYERDTSMHLRDLVVAVESRESGTSVDDVSAGANDAAAVALHHVHLPKLDDAGVVDYDTERRVVEPTGVEEIAEFCERLR